MKDDKLHGLIKPLSESEKTFKKVALNHKRNKEQDNTEALDQLTQNFEYKDCKDEYWNPEKFSLLYGTPLFKQATQSQKIILNHLYWVGYYSQIISAEIATIFLNQTSAAGLYSLEDFRVVCDNLDLESTQERAHINSFKKVSEKVEEELFGKRIFTYPMRNFSEETMIFQKTNQIKRFWKKIQLHAFSVLSSGNAFIACQYFTVRGLRTLNGKIVQHQLSQYYMKHPDKENAPIPSKISYHHFLDESYHFNSSSIIGHDILGYLKPPTAFESMIANMGLWGTQKDHSHFNVCVNGIFWYEPALFEKIYEILRSPVFHMSHKEALEMMYQCFCVENEGVHHSFETFTTAKDSYIQYVSDLPYVNQANKEMRLMRKTTIQKYLEENRKKLKTFEAESEKIQNRIFKLSA